MDNIYLEVIFSLVMVSLVLFGILYPVIRNLKVSNYVINCDFFSRYYLFKVNYGEEEFLQRMSTHSSNDILPYTFSAAAMFITFYENGHSFLFTVTVKEFDGGCYIIFEKNYRIYQKHTETFISYINEFMIKKADVELLQYDEYKHLVAS